MEGFRLKARTVTRNKKPMANLAGQEFDRTDRRELPPQVWVCRVGSLRKNKPDTIVPWRFLVLPQHTNDPVTQIYRKTRKHPIHFWVQGRKRIQNKCVRGLLFYFRRARHGLLTSNIFRLPHAALAELREPGSAKLHAKICSETVPPNGWQHPTCWELNRVFLGSNSDANSLQHSLHTYKSLHILELRGNTCSRKIVENCVYCDMLFGPDTNSLPAIT
jgi:hypothetical protein